MGAFLRTFKSIKGMALKSGRQIISQKLFPLVSSKWEDYVI